MPLAALLMVGSATLAAAVDTPLEDRPIVWFADDRQPIREPQERDPNLYWDMFDDSVLRPLDRLLYPPRLVRRVGTLLGGDPVAPAANTNRLDEVPNSSWFTNRIGLFPLTPAEAARGPGRGTGPDRTAPWTVIRAKTQGVTPGFVIRDARGDTYVIKFDPPGHLGMTISAGIISNRILFAAGYNVPEDALTRFQREDLVLGNGVRLTLADGTRRDMTAEDLETILASVEALPTGEHLALASKYVDGRPLGPFDYQGRRPDDPNDRIPHEDRRELRGLRLIAAWINHFDTKQHNSLDAYVSAEGRGHVRHYLIDFASTLGAAAGYGPVPRYGFEQTFDPLPTLGRALALGFHEDPWRRLSRPDGLLEIGYLEAVEFDPFAAKALQPNSAFANMTARDAYWAAKIISAFTDEHLRAIVTAAQYRDDEAAHYMTATLAARRDRTARRVFDRTPPLDFFRWTDKHITWRDLGVERGIYPPGSSRYRVRIAAVDADGHRAARTDWRDASATLIDCGRGDVAELLARAPQGGAPFILAECQVDRGGGWSQSVQAYFARASQRIVALER